MISYAIEALVVAGISEMMVVTGGTHAGEFLRLLSNGEELGVDGGRLAIAGDSSGGNTAAAVAVIATVSALAFIAAIIGRWL